ncbi:MAG: hypothetical protein AAB758_02145, partial [Patescibacteria group bacterium]
SAKAEMKPAPKYTPKPAPVHMAPKVSLEELKKKSNNQRKPDEKNVSALRDALKSVMGEMPTTQKEQKNSIASPSLRGLPHESNSPIPSSSKTTGPNPEELKKMLGVE